MRTYYIDVQVTRGSARKTAVLVIGSKDPSLEEKLLCLAVVTRLVDDGWRVAGFRTSVIGQLAHRTAARSGGAFVNLDQSREVSRVQGRTSVSVTPHFVHIVVGGDLR